MGRFAFVKSHDPNVAVLHGLRVWAENGSIHMENKHGLRILPDLKEATDRIRALCDVMKTAPGSIADPRHRQLKNEIENFANHAMAIIGRAREQGNFYDPSGRRDRVRRAAKTIPVSLYSL